MKNARFTVASWNVNSVKARLPHLLDFLKEVRPDVVCLQELKCEDASFPFEALASTEYKATIYGQKTYNGVAILSRWSMQSPTYGFDGLKSPTSARLVSAKIGDLTVYSVYVPNGQEVGSEKYMEKLEFFKKLSACLKERHTKQDPFIIAGDFNVARDEIDVHDPAAWRGNILFSDRERKSLENLIETGLTDTYRFLHPKGRDYSWWDYRGFAFQKNFGMRIDMIYVSEALKPHLKEASVAIAFRKKERPSDHAPVIAAFSLIEGGLIHQTL